jgi:hypothetical protein
MKKYINAIMMLSSIGMLFYIIYHQKGRIKVLESTNKSLIVQCDSLRSKQFISHINEQRFESIIDRAEGEMSPDCKEEFEKILHETE